MTLGLLDRISLVGQFGGAGRRLCCPDAIRAALGASIGRFGPSPSSSVYLITWPLQRTGVRIRTIRALGFGFVLIVAEFNVQTPPGLRFGSIRPGAFPAPRFRCAPTDLQNAGARATVVSPRFLSCRALLMAYYQLAGPCALG